MKGKDRGLTVESSKGLYIPHGSDESSCRQSAGRAYLCFISHMVQMKVFVFDEARDLILSFISHMVQMKALPTLSHEHLFSLLYIPHGSDERKQKRTEKHYGKKSLYPTWFR